MANFVGKRYTRDLSLEIAQRTRWKALTSLESKGTEDLHIEASWTEPESKFAFWILFFYLHKKIQKANLFEVLIHCAPD